MTSDEPTLVVCHDAGGSEVVSSWVKAKCKNSVHFLLEGPAVSIFARKLSHKPILLDREQFENIPTRYSFVLTGTSWASDLEKHVHRLCKKTNIKSAAYLDHWMEYPQRFTSNGELQLPDEIWVGDEYALRLAEKTLPGAPIRLEPNLYLTEIASEIKKATIAGERNYTGNRILYCTEPTSEVARKKSGNPMSYGYTEFSALENFIIYLKGQKRLTELRIRKHPSEPEGKYAHFLRHSNADFSVYLSESTDLTADCAWADIVAGCDSMVMAIGVFAKKKVFCCIPGGGKALSIPMPEIIQLFQP